MRKNKKQNKIVERAISFISKKKKLAVAVIVLFLMIILLPKLFTKNEKENTTVIQKGTVSEQLVLSGEIKATEDVDLYFPTSGKITWIGVKEGQIVKKWQALAKLDTTQLNADYQKALADLRSAETSVQKIHDDLKDHSSDETFAQKETRTIIEVAKDKAYESVKKAEQNLKDSTLISPFSGIVTYIANPFSNVYVLFSQKQIEIVNPETIYFEVTADQTEVGSIFAGQKAQIILDSFSNNTFEGEVENISYTPKENETSTVYVIKVKFINLPFEKEKLRIGMSGDIKFILASKENVLWISPKFINSDTKGKYVIIGKNRKYIETGLENEDQIEISGDVNERDLVTD